MVISWVSYLNRSRRRDAMKQLSTTSCVTPPHQHVHACPQNRRYPAKHPAMHARTKYCKYRPVYVWSVRSARIIPDDEEQGCTEEGTSRRDVPSRTPNPRLASFNPWATCAVLMPAQHLVSDTAYLSVSSLPNPSILVDISCLHLFWAQTSCSLTSF